MTASVQEGSKGKLKIWGKPPHRSYNFGQILHMLIISGQEILLSFHLCGFQSSQTYTSDCSGLSSTQVHEFLPLVASITDSENPPEESRRHHFWSLVFLFSHFSDVVCILTDAENTEQRVCSFQWLTVHQTESNLASKLL